MIKTPLSTVIGGAFWTPGATIIGSTSATLNQLIKSIFLNNDEGFAYDPNDLTTMWQDQAKLMPVTGAGQPVWHILDKSGNNNHAFATSSATRPILQRHAATGAYYLAFDGVDDCFATNNIDFTGTDKFSLFAGVRKLRNNGTEIICEFGNGVAVNNGSFRLNTWTDRASWLVNGASTLVPIDFDKPTPFSAVLSASLNISGTPIKQSFSFNRELKQSTASLGGGNLGNYPLYLFRGGDLTKASQGNFYGLIGIGRLTTVAETSAIEREFSKRIGVILNA